MSAPISLDDLLAIRNRIGRDPYRRAPKRKILSVDAGVGEANYLLQIPLLSLPGRGLDLSLTLSYNSKLWTQQTSPDGTILVYDRGGGWPTQGWSLGFGKVLQIGADSVLQDADGTFHPFSSGSTGFYTTDGTLIDYSMSWNDSGPAGGNGSARYPDGTAVSYGAASYSANYWEVLRLFPTRVTDANGNTIEITYVNNAGPAIQSITDTLGRAVDFVYGDVDIGFGTIRKLLTAIQAPGLKGAMRDVARFHYTAPLNVPHPGNPLYAVPGDVIGIDAVYLPATSTGYWFGDTDSYSPNSGIITKVSQRSGMTLTSASASDQGTITPGRVTRERRYDYPADLQGTTIPTYTKMTETWAVIDTPGTTTATTMYTVDTASSPRRTDTVYPDGSQVSQLMFNHPGQYDDGLLYQVMTYDSPGAQKILLQQTAATWPPLFSADGELSGPVAS